MWNFCWEPSELRVQDFSIFIQHSSLNQSYHNLPKTQTETVNWRVSTHHNGLGDVRFTQSLASLKCVNGPLVPRRGNTQCSSAGRLCGDICTATGSGPPSEMSRDWVWWLSSALDQYSYLVDFFSSEGKSSKNKGLPFVNRGRSMWCRTPTRSQTKRHNGWFLEMLLGCTKLHWKHIFRGVVR